MNYWTTRRPVRRQRAVDVSALARAAVRLLDQGGLESLTVRAVARELGVAPASLYSRVDSVEDILDLALDTALSEDPSMQAAITPAQEPRPAGAELDPLLLAFFRHLCAHPWAASVIARRALRGPEYLRLSERLCELLEDAGAADPLGASYAMSNFVIGSAATSAVDADEMAVPVDPEIAPRYARLHDTHVADSEEIVRRGVAALRSALTA